MSEPIIKAIPTPSRLVNAFIKVAHDVALEVIQKAQITKTSVIISDEEGNIQAVDPNILAEKLKNSQ